MGGGCKMAICLLLNILLSVMSSSATVVDVSTFEWGGVSAFIVVNRQTVQRRLDDYRLRTKAPELEIPENPIFPDLLTKNEHLVYVDFGDVTSNDLNGEPTIGSLSKVMSVTIPFLQVAGGGSGSSRHYALSLGKMCKSTEKDTYNPQLISTYTPVKEFTIWAEGASLSDQGEYISVTFNQTHPCQRSPADIDAGFNHLLASDTFDFSSRPDLNFCRRHREVADSHFCHKMADISDNVQEELPNVCARYSLSSHLSTPCKVSLNVVDITPRLRAFLLLEESGPIKVLAAEEHRIQFTSSFRYPCVE